MTIKLRFTFFISVATAIIIGGFSWAIYSLVQKEMYRQATLSLDNFLKHESEHVIHADESSNKENHFGEFLLRVSSDDKVIYDSIGNNNRFALSPDFLFTSVTKIVNGKSYILTGAYDLRPLRKYLDSLFKNLMLGCLLSIGIILPLSLGLSFILLKPFRVLAQGTSKLSAEDLSFRFSNQLKQDEIGVLISSFNALLARLERSFTQTKKFTSNASHEIRTPISVILGQSEMALRKERTNSEYKTVIEKCCEQAVQLKHTVENLLSLFEIERIQTENRISTIRVRARLEEILKNFQYRLGAEKKINLYCAEDLEFVGSDTAFWSICSNLIENAIKFSRSNIEVSCMEQGGALIIMVDDDGPGYNNGVEVQSRRDESKSPSKGYGLGISIIRAFLETFGGDLEFRSSKLGGASAIVSLPNYELKK